MSIGADTPKSVGIDDFKFIHGANVAEDVVETSNLAVSPGAGIDTKLVFEYEWAVGAILAHVLHLHLESDVSVTCIEIGNVGGCREIGLAQEVGEAHLNRVQLLSRCFKLVQTQNRAIHVLKRS